MDTIADILLSREEALLDPGVRRDPAVVESLLADDFLEFGSSGRAWTRDQIIELLANETFSPVQIESFHCDLLADGVALVTYRALRTDAQTGNRTSSLRSSIWTNRLGEWRVRFHQGTRTF
jgi:hypothetical protein